MRKLFLILLVFANVHISLATTVSQNSGRVREMSKIQGQDGNGGDPRAAEFLQYVKETCFWIKKEASLKAFTQNCFNELKDLSDSINSPQRVARISSIDKALTDDSGVPKMAVTSFETRRIKIDARSWDQASENQKGSVAAMEMALLLDIPRRYDIARLYLKDHQPAVVSTTQSTCGIVYSTMSSLIDTYIDIMKSCYSMEESGKTSSVYYRQERVMAVSIEQAYAKNVNLCLKVCENSNVCSGPQPSGACQTR
jgi:hypothetical protein